VAFFFRSSSFSLLILCIVDVSTSSSCVMLAYRLNAVVILLTSKVVLANARASLLCLCLCEKQIYMVYVSSLMCNDFLNRIESIFFHKERGQKTLLELH
jgi:hypothetical protein